MHVRNIFNNSPPDFQQLSIEYPEFSPHVTVRSSGKASLNYKDQAALRSLSRILLKKYFDLDVTIPAGTLVPTVPLRLNYIHWLEDLTEGNRNVLGFDIGCGASCVYPLLGNKMNGWSFHATEVNEASYQSALENVCRNKASEFIKIHLTVPSQSLFSAITTQFDFSMCNPPFFNNVDMPVNRSGHRPPPSTACVCDKSERSTYGGEVEFVKRMVLESEVLREKVRWYTTMLGKKSSLKPIINFIKENKALQVTTTEFHQGRTTRWGIAWTFTTLKMQISRPLKRKIFKPFKMTPSEDFCRNYCTGSRPLEEVRELIANMMRELKVDTTGDYLSALKNTWIGARRKRRRQTLQGDVTEQSDVTDVRFSYSVDSPNTYLSSAIEVTFVFVGGNYEHFHQLCLYIKNKLDAKQTEATVK